MTEQNAPERIWAWDDSTPMERNKGWSACVSGTGSTEYVRADLYDAAWNEAIEAAAAVSGNYMIDEADELLLDMWREDVRALRREPSK